MDPEKQRRKRVERYVRRVYIRRKVEERGGKELARGTRRGVESNMKRKEISPCGSVREYVVLEWSTYEDRPAKRRGKEEMVSSRDTNSKT
jgi:hypothetical protein